MSWRRYITASGFTLIAVVATLAVMSQQTMTLYARHLIETSDHYEAPDVELKSHLVNVQNASPLDDGEDLLAADIESRMLAHSRYVYPSKPCS